MDIERSAVKRGRDTSPAQPIRAPKSRRKFDDRASTASNTFSETLSQAVTTFLAAYHGDDTPFDSPDQELERVSPAMHHVIASLSAQFHEAQEELTRLRALNAEPTHTYASVAADKQTKPKSTYRPEPLPRKTKSTHVVLVKAKTGPDTSPLDIQEEVKKAFDPVALGVGITAIRTSSNGEVRVIVSSAADSNTVKNSIASSAISSKVEVTLPAKLRPRIIIFNSDSSVSINTFRAGLINQNADIRNAAANDDTALKFIREIAKKGSSTQRHLVFETSPAVFNAFHRNKRVFSGHGSYRFEETLRVRQCFKCGKYGHIAEKCRSSLTCSHCSGGHDQKDCPDKDRPDSAKCSNCLAHNHRDPKSTLPVNHTSYSSQCPLYIRQINFLRQRLDYGC